MILFLLCRVPWCYRCRMYADSICGCFQLALFHWRFYVAYIQAVMNYRTFLFFFKRVYKRERGDVWSICVLLLGGMSITWFFKAAFVMVSLSNKCISLICLQPSEFTWQPNVPNASGVGLFWDKKLPPRVALFYSDRKKIGKNTKEVLENYQISNI